MIVWQDEIYRKGKVGDLCPQARLITNKDRKERTEKLRFLSFCVVFQ